MSSTRGRLVSVIFACRRRQIATAFDDHHSVATHRRQQLLATAADVFDG